jgi:acyl-coenzyme A synthetase/AMP-(fatty) acid ligase
MSQLDVVAMTKYIVAYPLTRLLTLPPIIHFLNNLNNEAVFRALSLLKEIFVGAAPLSQGLQTEFRNKVHAAGKPPGQQNYLTKVVNVWGMTELSAAVCPICIV